MKNSYKLAIVAALTILISTQTFASVKGGIISRSGWKADESLRYVEKNKEKIDSSNAELDTYSTNSSNFKKVVTKDKKGKEYKWPLQYPKKVERFVIHHTATSNDVKNPMESIRAIYFYHAITRGWGDIGYNYIIDQNGKVYEGRAGGAGVVGGHARGSNTGSIGIAILGNFQEKKVPKKAMDALVELIRVKSKEFKINPNGFSKVNGVKLPNVIGHRDVGRTVCPGDYLYEKLPEIRKSAAKISDSKSKKDYAFEGASDFDSLELESGETKEVVLKLKNTGNKDWDKNTYILVDSNPQFNQVISFPEEKKYVLGKLEGSSVRSGKTGTFKFKVKAEIKESAVEMKIAVMVDGKTKTADYFTLPVTVKRSQLSSETNGNVANLSESTSAQEDATGRLTGTFVSKSKVEESFQKGKSYSLWINLRNTGETTWTRENFKLALVKNPDLEISNAKLVNESIGPGKMGRVTFKVTVDKNSQPGEKTLIVRPMVNNSYISIPLIKFEYSIEESDKKISSKKSTAKGTEGDIRIKLTFSGSPEITASGGFKVESGSETIGTFKKNAVVKVENVKGKYKVTAGSKTYTKTKPIRFIPDSGSILKVNNFTRTDNEFREILEVNIVDKELVLINELGLENYIKGLAEETNAAPADKIKSIAVAARTYAKYYMDEAEKFPGKPYNLEDSPATSQKYLGYTFEKRGTKVVQGAVETKGEMITYNGKLIKTPYFSRSDGVATKSAKDVWGWTNTPYLVSVDDSYCTTSTAFAGHGVGMSGCGATAMANKGFNYVEILKHYYTGVEITDFY
ncbi:MAG: SpoIID/LytB domain-containing protein [Candidatus Gracilibacteria bacterium]|nr:SpoIID/LytB domain-containing protein [Candidatus Gracilibacteria bacterium]